LPEKSQKKLAKLPIKTNVMEVGLPKHDYKGKEKAAVVVKYDDEQLDWGSQDENP
jgi:hypothetical protein